MGVYAALVGSAVAMAHGITEGMAIVDEYNDALRRSECKEAMDTLNCVEKCKNTADSSLAAMDG